MIVFSSDFLLISYTERERKKKSISLPFQLAIPYPSHGCY